MNNLGDIKWFGHSSFLFVDQNGNRIYYIDPLDLKAPKLEGADLVFITHAHPDHFSPNDLEKIVKDDTTIVAPPDILGRIDRNEKLKQTVEPNRDYEIKGFKFQTIPAYNNHPDKLSFHPKVNNWVGYIFELNARRVYHAGDTDFTPEMRALKNLKLDVAMLPIGGTYTMDANEAAEAANEIAAKITIPMHYRRMNSNYRELEEQFKKLVTNSQVVIMEELK